MCIYAKCLDKIIFRQKLWGLFRLPLLVQRAKILPLTHKCPCRKNILIKMYVKTYGEHMSESTGYYVVRKQAVPEVLLKVVEAKRLLESGRVRTVNEAVESLGISRSSFYKYKDDIYEFHDSLQGTTLTLTFQMNDELGLLSDVLGIISKFGANILTIHQSIPLNGVASLSVSIQVLSTTGNIMEMIAAMEQIDGVHKVQIAGRSANVS